MSSAKVRISRSSRLAKPSTLCRTQQKKLDGETSVEVVDPQTLLPIDEETIFESIEKTGRVILADNTNRTCSMAADIAARIANQSFWDLEAPVKRITRANVPVAYDTPEEQYIVPDTETMEIAIVDVTEQAF